MQGGRNRGLEGRLEVVILRANPPKRGQSPRTETVTPSTNNASRYSSGQGLGDASSSLSLAPGLVKSTHATSSDSVQQHPGCVPLFVLLLP